MLMLPALRHTGSTAWMHDLLVFRENLTDFHRWCSYNVKRAQSIIRMYESIHSESWLYNGREDYEDALKIQRQYVVLKASLQVELQMYLDLTLINGEDHNWNSTYCQEIYNTWREICFHRKHELDAFMLGHKLRELRIIRGFSAAKIAGILRISPATLYAYEEGTRKISADILYRLSQIYRTSIDELIKSITKN